MRSAIHAITGAAIGLSLALAAPAAAVPVTASFSITPAAPLTLEPVTFESTSTGTIATQDWDLDGDGDFDDASGPTASRSFGFAGTFIVRLRVTGDGAGTQERNLSVANRPPLTALAWFPAQPVAGQPASLVSTSQDPDGRVVLEQWDLDADGAFDDGAGPAVAWTFRAPGPATVRLRAVDDLGAETVAERAVPVAERVFPLISPFPLVRLMGTVSRTSTLVRRLAVEAPPGATVKITCSGPGCPGRPEQRTVAEPARTMRFKAFERRLRARAALRVYVTEPDTFGKFSRFWFRRNRPPARRDLCLAPGTTDVVRCPAG